MCAEEIRVDSSLRHFDSDAEEAIGAFVTRADFAPRRVVEVRLTPHAVDARVFADTLAAKAQATT